MYKILKRKGAHKLIFKKILSKNAILKILEMTSINLLQVLNRKYLSALLDFKNQ